VVLFKVARFKEAVNGGYNMTLKVEGMTCGHCQKAVKEALEGVPGAQNVEVDLKAGVAKVDGVSDPKLLIEAVVEEGYQASVAN
jgi:copper chaperone